MKVPRRLNIRVAQLKVYNLDTGDELLYTNMSPAEALQSAYRLSRGDANTWDWPNPESEGIREGEYGWHLGEFSVPFEDKTLKDCQTLIKAGE